MTHKKIFTMKTALLSLTVALLLGITACAEDIIDSANITIKQTPASLDAPEIKGKAYKGVNIITWAPVKNATGYRLYRDNKFIKSFAYNNGELRHPDYASFDEDSIKDKQKYTYTVVATGVQASRGTNASTSNTTDFVMTDADILGDSMASVTLTAKVPAAFTKVEAAKKPELKYVNDAVYGRVCGLYFTKPDYLGATINFAHQATGADVDIFSYLSGNFFIPYPYSSGVYADYAWVPFYYGGSYSYKITTYWPNPFYQSNDDMSGDIEIPSAEGQYAPEIDLDSEIDGVVVTVNGLYWNEKATYTLYRADYATDKAYEFSAIATGDKFKYIKNDCESGFGSYIYKDTTAEMYKQYIYMLTGTVDGKALLFSSSAPAVGTIIHAYAGILDWEPQFAAYNNDGTVDLSWNVEDGINYKVLKCTIASEDGTNEDSHTEEYLTVDAAKVAAAVNGVFVMTDTITKLTDNGWYKYTLIGSDDTGLLGDLTNDLQNSADAKIKYNVTAPFFAIMGVDAYDTKKAEGYNGLNDTILVTVVAENDIDMSTIKFYRAEIARDNKLTSAGTEWIGTDPITGDDIYAYYEFVTEYKPVTLTLANSKANAYQTMYEYTDTSLTETDLAMKAYIYIAAVTVDGKDQFAIIHDNKYTMCYNDIDMPNIICNAGKVEGANGPEAKDVYKLSWNARFAETIPDSTPEGIQSAYSAVLSVEFVWSNADSINFVTDAWTAVTDYSLADSTYFKEFSLTKDNNYPYLYVRVTLANAGDIGIFSKKITNRAYVGQVNSTVVDIDVAEIYTSKTAHPSVCYIKMKKGSADLLASNYTIYVTYLNATNSAIYSVPVPAGVLTKVTVTKDDGDNTVNAAYTTDEYPTWYFSTPTTEDTNVTAVLVHVETSEGEIARAVVPKWW